MSVIPVYYAGILLEKLIELDVDVKNHMSGVDDKTVKVLRGIYKKQDAPEIILPKKEPKKTAPKKEKTVGEAAKPEKEQPKTFDDIKAKIASGDIAIADDSEHAKEIRKASPSVAAEWAGYM